MSQRLKALEQQLGRVLVVCSRPARLTEAGQAVVRLARQIALLEHDALGGLGLDGGAARIGIPLAVNADSLATWFLAPLARLSVRHGIDFDLHRADQNFTARLLESGTVMAAVTGERAPVAGCAVTPLGGLAYRAMATPAFADRWFPAGVSAEALATAPFVDFDKHDTLQHDWLRARGVSPWGCPGTTCRGRTTTPSPCASASAGGCSPMRRRRRAWSIWAAPPGTWRSSGSSGT